MSKPFDFTGEIPPRTWFRQVQEILSNGVTLQDNVTGVFLEAYIATSETEVTHQLGRIPKVIIPVMKYPNGLSTLEFTKPPTAQTLYLKRGAAGVQTLFIQ